MRKNLSFNDLKQAFYNRIQKKSKIYLPRKKKSAKIPPSKIDCTKYSPVTRRSSTSGLSFEISTALKMWRDGRAAEGARLESVYTLIAYRGFESRSLRHVNLLITLNNLGFSKNRVPLECSSGTMKDNKRLSKNPTRRVLKKFIKVLVGYLYLYCPN